jgi:hypothetical protein
MERTGRNNDVVMAPVTQRSQWWIQQLPFGKNWVYRDTGFN